MTTSCDMVVARWQALANEFATGVLYMVTVSCLAKIPTGVISNCHNGIYIGQDVQAFACERGWRYSEQFQMIMKGDDTKDAETYSWAWDEAEEWLNANIAEENHYFGSQPMAGCGCWGYWSTFDTEEID